MSPVSQLGAEGNRARENPREKPGRGPPARPAGLADCSRVAAAGPAGCPAAGGCGWIQRPARSQAARWPAVATQKKKMCNNGTAVGILWEENWGSRRRSGPRFIDATPGVTWWGQREQGLQVEGWSHSQRGSSLRLLRLRLGEFYYRKYQISPLFLVLFLRKIGWMSWYFSGGFCGDGKGLTRGARDDSVSPLLSSISHPVSIGAFLSSPQKPLLFRGKDCGGLCCRSLQ